MLGVVSINLKKRTKRGLLNVVRSISNTLFGILDGNDAIYCNNEIKKLNENQEFILNLLRRQTSITECTVHILKFERNKANNNNKECRAFSLKVQELLPVINKINKNVNQEYLTLIINFPVFFLNLLHFVK